MKEEVKMMNDTEIENIEQMDEGQEQSFTFSNENYKNETIFEENFSFISSPLENNFDNLSLFERKDTALLLFEKRQKDKSIKIEDILKLDNTNKKIQLEYLKIAINNLSNEKNTDNISILLEKINKCAIICDEEDYNKIILYLPEKYKEKVEYINYKKNLIDTLKLILAREKENDFKNVQIILKSFKFYKRYIFNHESEFGENNYFFYNLVFQIILSNLENKLYHFDLYKIVIQKIIAFLEKYDFLNPKEVDMNYFEFLFNLLTDNKTISKNSKKYDLIINYMNSYENHLLEKIIFTDEQIKEINDFLIQFKNSNPKTQYIFSVNHDKINVDLIDKPWISRRERFMQKHYEYDIKMFNKEIFNTIMKNLKHDNIHNFESIFLRNVRCGMEEKPNEKFINKYKEIIKKILQSDAARKYFQTYYGSKNKGLSYHFDREDVIEEIFKRIKFSMIFRDGDQAYTSPVDLKIYVNCIPGEYDSLDINIFEMKILQFSRLITNTIHEIMGHFLRRYYSYLTNNLVKFGTAEDKVFVTGKESGKFVETNFLGLEVSISSLSLCDSMGYFRTKFEKYPILYDDQVPKEDLDIIIEKNPEFFDFICEKNNQIEKISSNELYAYLLKGYQKPSRVKCGSRKENSIYLEHPYFLD